MAVVLASVVPTDSCDGKRCEEDDNDKFLFHRVQVRGTTGCATLLHEATSVLPAKRPCINWGFAGVERSVFVQSREVFRK